MQTEIGNLWIRKGYLLVTTKRADVAAQVTCGEVITGGAGSEHDKRENNPWTTRRGQDT